MTTPSMRARGTLPTLPLSFPDPTGVVFVDGDPGWPVELRRAMQSGPAGIVLVHPVPTDFADLLTADASAAVVIDSQWASNPAVSLAAPAFRRAAANGGRVGCRVTLEPGSDFAIALLDQVVLIRALLRPVTDLRVRHLSDRTLHAEGRTDAAVVDFSIVCTSALPPSAIVRLLTTDGSVVLQLPSGDTAQPARLTTVGPDGAVLAPTHYETGHRASLRRLREMHAAEGMADLRRLHADVMTTTAALGDHLRERSAVG
jgi:hypothetical protein